jgi:hypothetical protein
MEYPIEACCAPDGRWVATLPRIPGLIVYGESRQDAMSSARKLGAILREDCAGGDGKILAFRPGPTLAPYRSLAGASLRG